MKPRYRDTARAFDVVAPHYDAVYGPQANAVMTWMRQESLALLKATFPRGSYLLEIGCGTGEEAVALATAGRRVLATDISPKMAALTQAKARAAVPGGRVSALATPAANIGALQPLTPFDGAYASFGALNCEPHLERLGEALGHLIKPGGAFVCSVMARCCPFEMAWFILHGRPRVALRRLHRSWQSAPVAGPETVEVSVITRYLNARDVSQALSPTFTVERTLSLPLLLPPPYLDAVFRRHTRLFAVLERLEGRLRQRWPWRLWGDHIALVLRRPPSAT
jgi:SAM-dependent methyltransferase